MPSSDGWFNLQYPVDPSFFSEIGPKQAWLAGLFAADGCIVNNRVVSISQSGDHGLRLIEQVQEMLGHSAPILHHKNAHQVTVTSPELVELLARFNVTKRKTATYKYPSDMLTPDIVRPFIRGYIDGDGCVSIARWKDGRTGLIICFVGTSQFVSRAVEDIPIAMRVNGITRCPGMMEARIAGSRAIALGRWLWADRDLPRHAKQEKYEAYMETSGESFLRREQSRAEAIRMESEGINRAQIARDLGLQYSTVRSWLRRHAA